VTGTFLSSALNKRHSVFYSSSTFTVASKYHCKQPWIIDTSATDYMVSSIHHFTTITAVVSSHVKLPNGQFALVTHIGTVNFSDSLILTDVLCVPSFSFNLISASKLIKSINCCLIFIHKSCFVQNLTSWEMIGVGEEKDGLFYLVWLESVPLVSFAVSIKKMYQMIFGTIA
jgi:hypothetical protein